MLNYVLLILLKALNVISRTMETRHLEWHENCECKCRLDASACDNVGIKINPDVNVTNWLTMEYVIKNLCEILAITNVNLINRVNLENVWTIKNVNPETN